MNTTTPLSLKVVGLDLSLTSTGYAVIINNTATTDRLTPPTGIRGPQRMTWIRDHIRLIVGHANLVAVEGPSYGSPTTRQTGHHERAGLWWLIRVDLDRHNIPCAVVPPAIVKQYATGAGNAAKDRVLAAVLRRYPHIDIDGNDAADALVLAAIAARRLGHPIDELPATHLRGINKAAWPDGLPEPVSA